jgi:hypothetical protein
VNQKTGIGRKLNARTGRFSPGYVTKEEVTELDELVENEKSESKMWRENKYSIDTGELMN